MERFFDGDNNFSGTSNPERYYDPESYDMPEHAIVNEHIPEHPDGQGLDDEFLRLAEPFLQPGYRIENTQPDRLREICNMYLDVYSGKNLEGIDTERIDSFFDSNGLSTRQYIVIRPEDISRICEMDEDGFFSGVLQNGAEGVYSPELGLSVVVRDPANEEYNDVSYTEGLIVHEKAHSTSAERVFLSEGDRVGVLRVGFGSAQFDKGLFFEEGWAELCRGKYVAEHYEQGMAPAVAKQLGLQWNQVQDVSIGVLGRQAHVPIKYVHFNKRGLSGGRVSSLAATAIERMTRADPRIISEMHAARQQISKWPDVVRRIDALGPGLYRDLHELSIVGENELEVYARGLYKVEDTLR